MRKSFSNFENFKNKKFQIKKIQKIPPNKIKVKSTDLKNPNLEINDPKDSKKIIVKL